MPPSDEAHGPLQAFRPYYHDVYWKVRLDFSIFTRFSQTEELCCRRDWTEEHFAIGVEKAARFGVCGP